MKGPGLKLDLDIRRLWKCPQTGETIRLSGNVTAKTTQVDGETVFMQLVEEKRSLYRDPFHFDYYELPEGDQSSSERAAAAARSIEEPEPETEPIEEIVVTEEQSIEISSTAPEQSEPETLSNQDPPNEDPPSQDPEEEEDSFGGGLL
ncbi:hypothetical protein [uncultured Gimesia sp.]|uniref:hypothetical protein n=1 Tax=uncultured Gimesia sp. TaxID=1678688 RepID=UPI0030DB2852|tara:strand:- start:359110 stop:359553 length:444 start_codon:yes stop_codon:yes gene_type:complete